MGTAASVPRIRTVARSLLAVLLAAPLVLVGVAAPASAHNSLISANPVDGSTVEVAPGTIDLVFSEPAIALGTQVLVLGPESTSLGTGEPVLLGSTVSQPLAAERPAGAYTVEWRVTSQDGHPISGQLTFDATSAVGPPVLETPAPTPSDGAASADPTTPARIPATTTPAPEPSDGPAPTAGSGTGAAGGGVVAWLIVAGAAAVALAAGALWWVRRGQA